jgi:hypothetical protein
MWAFTGRGGSLSWRGRSRYDDPPVRGGGGLGRFNGKYGPKRDKARSKMAKQSRKQNRRK